MEKFLLLTCLLSSTAPGNIMPIIGLIVFSLLFFLLHRVTRPPVLADVRQPVALALAHNYETGQIVHLFNSVEGASEEPVLPPSSVNKKEFFEAIEKCRNRFCLQKLYKLVDQRKDALIGKTESVHPATIDADIAAYGEIENYIRQREFDFKKGEPETYDLSEFRDYLLCSFNKENWHELLTSTLKAEAIRLGCFKELILRSLELRFAK